MDQKRLVMAIAFSIAILLGWQLLVPQPKRPPVPPQQIADQTTPPPSPFTPKEGSPGSGAALAEAPQAEPANAPRLKIDADRLQGSIGLVGARIDDVVLTGYHETTDPASPLVRLLAPRSDAKPYYVQYGWSAGPGSSVKVPDPSTTVWTASAGTLTTGKPVTLSWDNGAGVTFEIELSVDADYMFSVAQRVRNAGGEPAAVYPWARVRRDYTPELSGYSIFEGMIGVAGGTLHETSYAKAKSEGEKHDGVAYESRGAGGWGGITDKYWLSAVIPDQAADFDLRFRRPGEAGDHYQVDYALHDAQAVPPGGEASLRTHLFVGAKELAVLDRYEDALSIPSFDKAVNFGWSAPLSKPMFYAIDWLKERLWGNFGLGIMAFTLFVKVLFFPLANYSYRSMSRMKLLGPKMTALRERLKDEPQKLQSEMMALYREEKVNPASGCLPMLLQVPVFISLYNVIVVTIELRQAPFFGWIRDLSQVDPTNVFNLFGVIPFDPGQFSHYLHLGVWPLIMGATMLIQQRLNPPPPDPMQARVFQFMPLIFMFMMANFPVGLVIYWSWNNSLSVAQQWLIQRRTKLPKPNLART